MKGGLQLQLRELSRQADRLQAEVVDLTEGIAELLEPGAFGDWVLVDDGFPPLPRELAVHLKSKLRFCGVETGPPSLPRYLFDIAATSIEAPDEQILRRADSVFFAGFYADCAIKTCTPYKQREVPDSFEPKHWVIFYRIDPHLSRRVTSKKCLEVAIEVEKDSI